jgi:hypothetical protein
MTKEEKKRIKKLAVIIDNAAILVCESTRKIALSSALLYALRALWAEIRGINNLNPGSISNSACIMADIEHTAKSVIIPAQLAMHKSKRITDMLPVTNYLKGDRWERFIKEVKASCK